MVIEPLEVCWEGEVEVDDCFQACMVCISISALYIIYDKRLRGNLLCELCAIINFLFVH